MNEDFGQVEPSYHHLIICNNDTVNIWPQCVHNILAEQANDGAEVIPLDISHDTLDCTDNGRDFLHTGVTGNMPRV